MKTGSLLPREHGAYAEVLLPLATVWIAGEVGRSAAFLTLAALCAFLAHEPVSILLGRRGERARRRDGVRARWWLAVLVIAGAAGAADGLAAAGATTRLAALVPAALVALSCVLLATGRERTTAGEIVVAATLASAAIPIGVAAGLPVGTSVAIAAVWATGAGLATATVRGIVLAAKLTRSWQPEAAIFAAMAVLGVAAVLSVGGVAPAWLPPALCPLALLSIGLGAFRPAPARVRQVGWSFVLANLVTLAIVVAGA